MNILTEIAELLSSEENSLTDALLKLKIFASRIGNTNLQTWVNSELSGYTDAKKAPKYRKISTLLMGSYRNGMHNLTNQTLPTAGMPDYLRNLIESTTLLESVSVIENLSQKNTGVKFKPHGNIHIAINDYFRENNPYMGIYALSLVGGEGSYEQILIQIRTYALDLVLALEQELGYDIELGKILEKKKEVNQLINNYMTNIHTTGDGNIITSGDRNIVTGNIHIEKNNFDQLKKELLQKDIEEADIIELESVIDEEPNNVDKVFGKKVNEWISKMVSKALDGSWKIAVPTAAAFLTECLKKYYGL